MRYYRTLATRLGLAVLASVIFLGTAQSAHAGDKVATVRLREGGWVNGYNLEATTNTDTVRVEKGNGKNKPDTMYVKAGISYTFKYTAFTDDPANWEVKEPKKGTSKTISDVTFDKTGKQIIHKDARVVFQHKKGAESISTDYVRVVVEPSIDVIPVAAGNEPVDLTPGVICTNAQPIYRRAKWEVVAPSGVVVTASLSTSVADDVILEPNGKPLNALEDGDTFWAKGVSKYGQYKVKVVDNSNSSNWADNESLVFEFVTTLNNVEYPWTLQTRSGNNFGNEGDDDPLTSFWTNVYSYVGGSLTTGNVDNYYTPYGIGDSQDDFERAELKALRGTLSRPGASTTGVGMSNSKLQIATRPKGAYSGRIATSFDVNHSASVFFDGEGSFMPVSLKLSYSWKVVSIEGPTVINAGAEVNAIGVLAIQVGDGKAHPPAKTKFSAIEQQWTDAHVSESKTLSIKYSTQTYEVSMPDGTADICDVRHEAGLTAEKADTVMGPGNYAKGTLRYYFNNGTFRRKNIRIIK